jgi:hypothetical protein
MTPEWLAEIREFATAIPRRPLGAFVYEDMRDLLNHLDAVTREREKLERKAELLSRTVDRYLPCPDHRDKTEAGKCYVCECERLTHHLLGTPRNAVTERGR